MNEQIFNVIEYVIAGCMVVAIFLMIFTWFKQIKLQKMIKEYKDALSMKSEKEVVKK